MIFRLIMRIMRNDSEKVLGEITTHILCSLIFFFDNRVVYEVM
jgi:hypothetical protein